MRTQSSRAARTGKHGKTCRVTKITAAQFRELRLYSLLSVADAAKVLHVTERTVHNWESGSTRVPYAAFKLLRILRGYELPGDSWRGWVLYRDVLITPEGHHLRAADGAYWSLLAAQAQQFRVMLAERHKLRHEAPTAAAVGASALAQPAESGTLQAAAGVEFSPPGAPPYANRGVSRDGAAAAPSQAETLCGTVAYGEAPSAHASPLLPAGVQDGANLASLRVSGSVPEVVGVVP